MGLSSFFYFFFWKSLQFIFITAIPFCSPVEILYGSLAGIFAVTLFTTLKRIVLPMPTETPPCYDLRCGILVSCILWFHYTCIPAHFQRPFFFVLIAFEPIFQSVVTDFVYSHFFLFFLVYSHCTIIPIFYCNLSVLFPTLFCFHFVSFYTFCIQSHSVSMHI